MKKRFNLLIVFAFILMVFPNNVKAVGSTFNEGNLNSCVSEGKCFLLCAYNAQAFNNMDQKKTSVEVYYHYDSQWQVVFDTSKDTNPRKNLVNDGDPYYMSENVAKVFQAGGCTSYAFYETNMGNQACITQTANGCKNNDSDWEDPIDENLVYTHINLVEAELKSAVTDKISSYTCEQVTKEENPETMLNDKITGALKTKFYGGNDVPAIIKNSPKVQNALTAASSAYSSKVKSCIDDEKKALKDKLDSGQITEEEYKKQIAELDKKASDINSKLNSLGSKFGILRPNINVKVNIDPNGCSLISSDFQEWLQWILDTIRIAGLVLTVVLGVTDYAKASFSSKDDAMKTANKNFSTRLLALALLLLVPAIVEVTLTILNIGVTAENPTCGIN